MVDQTIAELAPTLGKRAACAALGRSRATYYRWHRQSPPPPHQPRAQTPQPRALSQTEREEVLGLLHEERFVDQAPATIYATLLDEGRYVCSVPTMYRVLRAADEVHERRRQARHPATVKPELVATSPNQVWSWDITKLRGPEKWTYFHLYVIIDIYSRYVAGWLLAKRETAALAEHLIAETIRKHNVIADQLTIHADRGTSMASKTVALLLADLAVTKSHSRPIAPTITPTQRHSSRPSSTDQSSPTASAPLKMAAPSASASSGGTTTTTAILVSASTPRPPSTSDAPKASTSSALVSCTLPLPLTPSASFATHQSHPGCQG